jgi:hypothetical protein
MLVKSSEAQCASSPSVIIDQSKTSRQKNSITNLSLADAKRYDRHRSDFCSGLGYAQCLYRHPYSTATNLIGKEDAPQPLEDPELRHDSRLHKETGNVNARAYRASPCVRMSIRNADQPCRRKCVSA